jgi:hypothetical protein
VAISPVRVPCLRWRRRTGPIIDSSGAFTLHSLYRRGFLTDSRSCSRPLALLLLSRPRVFTGSTARRSRVRTGQTGESFLSRGSSGVRTAAAFLHLPPRSRPGPTGDAGAQLLDRNPGGRRPLVECRGAWAMSLDAIGFPQVPATDSFCTFTARRSWGDRPREETSSGNAGFACGLAPIASDR